MKTAMSHSLSLASACLLLFIPSTCAIAGQNTGQNTAQADDKIVISHSATIPHEVGPASHFSGAVTLDMYTEPKDAGLTRTESVTFAPNAHTNWHSHPHGQILVVTAGSGVIQQRGGPVQQIHAGDVIWTPPNVQHWHGAGPNGPMTHISIYQEPAGDVTKWFDPVSDADFRAAMAKAK